MATLLNIALANAVMVAPLALIAWGVSRIARRPALTHALWVLVLLKFITPPLFNLPLTIEVPRTESPLAIAPAAGAAGHAVSPALVASHDANASPESSVTAVSPSFTPASAEPAGSPNRTTAGNSESGASRWSRTLSALAAAWAERPGVQSLLLASWLAGVAFWTLLQIVRAVRFQRQVMRDPFAPAELQEQVRQLAAKLGLRRVPQVLIVDAAVSPMLWGCGSKARLLFPLDLANRLDDQARATLLTHELAHYGRGDHWVRLLELVATGMFWWHPVAWFARRQIEEAEEECCDAWVVSQFPHAPRQYADALLDTIDFLCESRRALPPVASGLGQAHFLRHRLTRIMCGVTPQTLSKGARCTIALAAAMLLPLQPFVFGSSKFAELARAPLEQSAVVVPAASLTADRSTGDNHSPLPDLPEVTPAGDAMSLGPRASSGSRVRIPGERVWSSAVSPGGRFVVRTTTARRVLLTDLSTNSEVDLSPLGITAIAFAHDGEWFAAAGQDGRLAILDSASGEVLRTVLTHGDTLRSVAVSPHGNVLAAGSRDGSVFLNDLATGESLATLPRFASAVNCVRFSSDGQQLAVAIGDWTSHSRGEVALLNAATGETIASLDCAAAPGALTFASKDELIVGLWDGRTQLWNLVNRQVVGSAMADKGLVAAAAFSPDNPVLREVTFVAAAPSVPEDDSPVSFLRRLFATP